MAEQAGGGERDLAIGAGVILVGTFVVWYASGLIRGAWGTEDSLPNPQPDRQEQPGELPARPDLALLPQCGSHGTRHLMGEGDHDPQAPEYLSLMLGHEGPPVAIYAGEAVCPRETDPGQIAVNGVRCVAVSPLGQEGVGSTRFSVGCESP